MRNQNRSELLVKMIKIVIQIRTKNDFSHVIYLLAKIFKTTEPNQVRLIFTF